MRRPLVIYDYATDPIWISWYMRKIWFSFSQCNLFAVALFGSTSSPQLRYHSTFFISISVFFSLFRKFILLLQVGGRGWLESKEHWESLDILKYFPFTPSMMKYPSEDYYILHYVNSLKDKSTSTRYVLVRVLILTPKRNSSMRWLLIKRGLAFLLSSYLAPPHSPTDIPAPSKCLSQFSLFRRLILPMQDAGRG